MKIIHIAVNYLDGLGYQENLLPLYQKNAGDDVIVVSSRQKVSKSFLEPACRVDILNKGREYYLDGIKIYRIDTYLNISSTAFICFGLGDILEKESPDVIFHHNVGLATLSVASNYKKRHPNVKLYVDNHADWINESKNRIWHLFYYDFLMPLHLKYHGDNVDYFIGVSPLRCQYLNQVYRVPQNRIRFLPIGCDTEKVKQVNESKAELRVKHTIPQESFVVVSGGKIDRKKGTLTLIEACKELQKENPNLFLVLFGKIDEEISTEVMKHKWIKMFGWCDRIKTISLLRMADVACWPWLHTTLIEDSVAAGTPLVVKMSDNVSHFAREEAGVFMKNGNKDELMAAMMEVKENKDIYQSNVFKARQRYGYANLVRLLESEDFCEI